MSDRKSTGSLFITLDMGTTSVKVSLFNSNGDMLATSLDEYSLHTPEKDVVELHAEIYWDCCRKGIRYILGTSGVSPCQIKSIGVCSQGETLIVLDSDGRPLRKAIVWLDNRSYDEADTIRRVFGTENNTGQIDVCPSWPITKIFWLKKHEPEVFKRIDKFMLVEDYILYRLTGTFNGEYSLYSSSYMLDIVNKQWWRELLDFVGIEDEQLVSLCEPGEIIGPVTRQVSRELGLDPSTVVVTGAMDQIAAMIGSGNIHQGIVTETTGAALVVCSTLDAFPGHETGLMAVQYHAVPGKYLVIGWCPTGGMALKWLRDSFFITKRDEAISQNKDPYTELTMMAENIPPGSQGLLFYPYLAGPGTSDVDPDARGVFYGIEMHHKGEHFIKAVMESLAFVLRKNLEAVEALGIPCAEFISLGGGAGSRLWNTIKADVTGKPVKTLKCSEAASLGTAILQARALGLFPDMETAVKNMVHVSSIVYPEQDRCRIYEDVYRRFRLIERRCF
ncbi:MAG: FGGY family carbohydrate kinase [Gemmatimonadota bacterium]|nr:FGGY family carbohydrate kinase [Gemmatimonadota bacterium]